MLARARGARLASELLRQLESNGHADEHPQSGLLGEKRSHLAGAVARVVATRGVAHRLIVAGVEPSALIERHCQHPL